ncbi:MAG TPA: hypothetical protein VKS43_05605 [Burkholderiales bacterium]|nr:hypothetical protein [Burkholderiales bacterium]
MKPAAAILLGIAMSLSSAAAQTQELLRLFFTPDQRAALDERRKARVPDKPTAAPVEESPLTRVDGVVRRSGGKSTVWVNGETIPESAQPGSPKISPAGAKPDQVSIPVGEGAQPKDLRVGESLDRGNGEVSDLIGTGEIKIGPRPAATQK